MKPRRDTGHNRTNTIAMIIAAGLLLLPRTESTAKEPWLPFREHDVQWSADESTITIHTTGHDPFLVWRLPEGIAADTPVLEFMYFSTDKLDSMSGFLGPPLSEATRFDLPDLTIAESWQRYAVDLRGAAENSIPDNANQLRIDFGMKPNVRLQIRDVILRAKTAQEIQEASRVEIRRQQKIATAERISSYLNSSFALKFDEVIVDERTVTLKGKLLDRPTRVGDWSLVEFPSHASIGEQGIDVDAPIEITRDHFHAHLPRKVLGRDRLHSGWRIRDHNSERFLTARKYATTIVPGNEAFTLERPHPNSPKGLSGVSTRGPLEELSDLGIDAITVNLVLNHFLSSTDGEGRERIDVDGPPIYFDSRRFGHYDRLIDYARQHAMVVSAIVLVRRSQRAAQSPLVHAESDGGVYAMPELSSQRGAKLYAAVLDKIAHRYRHADQAPGGITNWIAHNEIDFHGVWTNMGAQPREVCTETYYRSMRIIHNTARAHNPHARVFASLTHHWVVPKDGKWRRLAPRDFLEDLQRYVQLEGEFAWGVAYHPYPQNLFAKVAWNDSSVSDDFETPLITIQNLEVLGRFLDRPEMWDGRGKMRPVILSEQGFHTDSYNEDAQSRQAGSLWYAMKKVASLPWIESFYYHRWIDHPDEGGLKLGLRTLPSETQPYGEKKRSWYVYQAIGTDSQSEATRDLPQP